MSTNGFPQRRSPSQTGFRPQPDELDAAGRHVRWHDRTFAAPAVPSLSASSASSADDSVVRYVSNTSLASTSHSHSALRETKTAAYQGPIVRTELLTASGSTTVRAGAGGSPSAAAPPRATAPAPAAAAGPTRDVIRDEVEIALRKFYAEAVLPLSRAVDQLGVCFERTESRVREETALMRSKIDEDARAMRQRIDQTREELHARAEQLDASRTSDARAHKAVHDDLGRQLAAVEAAVRECESRIRSANDHSGIDQSLQSQMAFMDDLRSRSNVIETRLEALESQRQSIASSTVVAAETSARLEQLSDRVDSTEATLHGMRANADALRLFERALEDTKRRVAAVEQDVDTKSDSARCEESHDAIQGEMRKLREDVRAQASKDRELGAARRDAIAADVKALDSRMADVDRLGSRVEELSRLGVSTTETVQTVNDRLSATEAKMNERVDEALAVMTSKTGEHAASWESAFAEYKRVVQTSVEQVRESLVEVRSEASKRRSDEALDVQHVKERIASLETSLHEAERGLDERLRAHVDATASRMGQLAVSADVERRIAGVADDGEQRMDQLSRELAALDARWGKAVDGKLAPVGVLEQRLVEVEKQLDAQVDEARSARQDLERAVDAVRARVKANESCLTRDVARKADVRDEMAALNETSDERMVRIATAHKGLIDEIRATLDATVRQLRAELGAQENTTSDAVAQLEQRVADAASAAAQRHQKALAVGLEKADDARQRDAEEAERAVDACRDELRREMEQMRGKLRAAVDDRAENVTSKSLESDRDLQEQMARLAARVASTEADLERTRGALARTEEGLSAVPEDTSARLGGMDARIDTLQSELSRLLHRQEGGSHDSSAVANLSVRVETLDEEVRAATGRVAAAEEELRRVLMRHAAVQQEEQAHHAALVTRLDDLEEAERNMAARLDNNWGETERVVTSQVARVDTIAASFDSFITKANRMHTDAHEHTEAVCARMMQRADEVGDEQRDATTRMITRLAKLETNVEDAQAALNGTSDVQRSLAKLADEVRALRVRVNEPEPEFHVRVADPLEAKDGAVAVLNTRLTDLANRVQASFEAAEAAEQRAETAAARTATELQRKLADGLQVLARHDAERIRDVEQVHEAEKRLEAKIEERLAATERERATLAGDVDVLKEALMSERRRFAAAKSAMAVDQLAAGDRSLAATLSMDDSLAAADTSAASTSTTASAVVRRLDVLETVVREQTLGGLLAAPSTPGAQRAREAVDNDDGASVVATNAAVHSLAHVVSKLSKRLQASDQQRKDELADCLRHLLIVEESSEKRLNALDAAVRRLQLRRATGDDDAAADSTVDAVEADDSALAAEQLEQLQNALNGIEDRVAEVDASVQSNLSVLQAGYEELHERVQGRLAEAEQNAAAAAAAAAAATSSSAPPLEVVDDGEVEQLRADVAGVQSALARTNASVETLRGDVEALQAARKSHVGDLTRVTAALDALVHKVEDLSPATAGEVVFRSLMADGNAPTAAASAAAGGEPLLTGVAGRRVMIVFEAIRKATGERCRADFSARVSYVVRRPGTGERLEASNLLRNADGVFSLAFRSTLAGDHRVELLIGDTLCGEWTVRVAPGPVDALASRVAGSGIREVWPGREAVFRVEPMDGYGNVSNVTPKVTVRGADCTMAVDLAQSEAGAPFIATYRAPDNGPAVVDVRVNGRHVAGSPFSVVVAEGILAATGFRAAGDGLVRATANTVASFSLTHPGSTTEDVDTSDFEVYLRHGDGSRDGIRFMPRVSFDVDARDTIQVRYVVDVDTAGTYALHISYMGDALPGSPFPLEIAADAQRTRLWSLDEDGDETQASIAETSVATPSRSGAEVAQLAMAASDRRAASLREQARLWLREAKPYSGCRVVDTGVTIRVTMVRLQAAAAGVRPRDIIVAVDGVLTPSVKDFADAIARCRPGRVTQFEIQRGGDRIYVEIEMGAKNCPQDDVRRWVRLADGEPL